MKFFQARNKNIIERSNYDVSLSNFEKKGQLYKNHKTLQAISPLYYFCNYFRGNSFDF